MDHPIDDKLRREVAHYRLRYTCTSCGQFDPDERRCALGCPSEPHQDPDLDRQATLAFCKYFELW